LRVELRFLGGAVPWIAVYDSTRPRKPKRKATAPKPPKRKKRTRATGKGGAGRMLRAGPGLIGGLIRQIRVERCRVECRFGLGDPADTGQAYGLLAPLVFAPPWGWDGAGAVVLTPDFERACLEGEAEVALAVVPARLLPPIVRFAWAAFGPGR
jgi:hypothetical protein